MPKLQNAPLQCVNRNHYLNGKKVSKTDQVAVEEPLQISLVWYEQDSLIEKVFTITMRTPGDDDDLVMGLLNAEGIICKAQDIDEMTFDGNECQVSLNRGNIPDLDKINRNQISQTACGLCGKTSLAALEILNPPDVPVHENFLSNSTITKLPQALKQHQVLFHQCGGIHAAGLFNQNGELLHLSEDIGRHNALDKLIGHQILTGSIPNGTEIIALSGRASFELVQKCIMGGYAVIIAVGAPSSLAIKAAIQFDITLIGFANQHSFNVYSGEWRLYTSL